MAVHTATVQWKDGSFVGYFLSVDGELYLEVKELPDNTEGVEQQIIDRMDGKGRRGRPMLWARRGLRSLQQEGHAVSFSDPEGWRSERAIAEKVGPPSS